MDEEEADEDWLVENEGFEDEMRLESDGSSLGWRMLDGVKRVI